MMEKLYIVVNNKVADKGKLARACATIGACNPINTRLLPTIVVKGGDLFTELYVQLKDDKDLSGVHIDAGHTQVEHGTILAFGVKSGTAADFILKDLKLL